MNQSPASIFISLGSNLGEREKNLLDAIHLITKLPHTNSIHQSKMYVTAAWGKTDQPDFINMVIEINSSLSPDELMNSLIHIEEEMGRVRNEHWGPRIIDLDILFYGNEIVNSPKLIIPHPELQNRNFVLVPLHEIASKFIHPVLKKSVAQLVEECPDKLTVLIATEARISNG